MIEKFNNWAKGRKKQIALDELLKISSSASDFAPILTWFQQEGIPISNPLEAYEFIGVIYQKICESRTIQKTNFRKHHGIYYTEYSIARKIITGILKKKDAPLQLSFLEPCVGAGIFVLTYVDSVLRGSEGVGFEKIQSFVDNIFCADIDADAIRITKILLKCHIRILTGFSVSLKDSNFYVGNILFSISDDRRSAEETDLSKIFGISKFDIIATNPPCKLLKLNENRYAEKTGSEEKMQYDAMLRVVGGRKAFRLQTGVCNYYKLFLEKIFCSYTRDGGDIGLLIPYTFLNDKTCELLRTYLLKNFVLGDVFIIPEKNVFFRDVCQSFCFFTATYTMKPGKNISIKMDVKSSRDFDQNSVVIKLSDLASFSSAYSVLTIPRDGWMLLKSLSSYPKLKSIPQLVNLRGELDLTLHKSWIQQTRSDYPLITGKCINQFSISQVEDYVSEEFVKRLKGKREYVFSPRLLCQQISNIHQKHRLKFALCNTVSIAGNSCNFISISFAPDFFSEDLNISLKYLLGVLNSLLLDWRFRITSSNNHVNNYEIDELPIKIPDAATLADIEKTVDDTIERTSLENLAHLNIAVFHAYDLSRDAVEYILSYYEHLQPELVRRIQELYDGPTSTGSAPAKTATSLSQSDNTGADEVLYNHESYQLSAMDMIMVKSIPPGGNWQNIPDDIPSKRVQSIKTTGGRTTLYGRLQWDLPSYTITTFFNRPGNGCYIHPSQDRVISAREAARLQSFPDSYVFYGTKTSYCKQIGNAVPPLMAFAFARQIKLQTGCERVLDLFCGAGGLSVGFQNAGYQIIAANDNFRQACETYRNNHPSTIMIEGDITTPAIREEIVKHSREGHVDIIVGGPPCQGFSYAGYRMIDDPRNFLYKEYVKIVSMLSPKVFLMENVEGILTSNNGKTYQSICEDFSALGYNLYGKKLFATWYGVPQKRKRVIIIGLKEGIPERCFPDPLLLEENLFITTWDAIGNLPAIPMGGGVRELNTKLTDTSDYQRFIEGKISFSDYSNGIRARAKSLSENLL